MKMETNRKFIKKNIGFNAFLNALRQTFTVIFPLITYPYALRVLGVDSIGKVNYSSSIITYFALFASLGISTYAIREGSRYKEDKERLTEFASQIFTINIISTIFSYILLFIVLSFVSSLNRYSLLIWILSLSIVFTTMGVDWINSIYEDYLYITIRSLITQIISLLLLFILVRSPEDYYLYAFLQVITNAIICVSNWFYCRKYVKLRLTLKLDLKKHIIPIMILFANNFAITVYVCFDTTMLGWWKGDEAVGYYTGAVKVYTIVKNILMAIYTVAIPRLAYLYGKKNYPEYKLIFSELWGKLTVLLIPAGVGLCVLAPQIMHLIGGAAYIKSAIALRLLSIALIFSIYAGLVSPVLNVTIGREKENLRATLISAVLNFVLNFYFISKFSFVGAAFTTMLSELAAFAIPFVRIKNIDLYLETKTIKKSLINVLISSFTIIGVYILVQLYLNSYILIIIFTVCISVIIYMFMLFILKDNYFLDFLEIIKKY